MQALFKDSSSTDFKIKMNKEKLALWSFITCHNAHNYRGSKTDSYCRQKQKLDIVTLLGKVFQRAYL